MSHKRLPYIFLSFLLLILFFIVGLRWGQNIEKTNKVINYLISIAPTATLAPTQPSIAIKIYKHDGCNLQFLQLSTSEVKSEASNGAILQEKNDLRISFDCSRNNIATPIATDSLKLTFQKKTIIATEKEGKYLFQLKNPLTGIITNFFVDKSFFPLFEKSLEFVAK